jgi:F0F1-type ATP synthase delta subunit
MKYSTHLYSKALAEVIAAAKPVAATKPAHEVRQTLIAKNFLALVRKNGDEAHLRRILEEAGKLVCAKEGTQKVILETARTLGRAQKESLQSFVKKGDVIEEKINPELVAGVRIIVDDEMQFDGSLRGKLDRLFGAV